MKVPVTDLFPNCTGLINMKYLEEHMVAAAFLTFAIKVDVELFISVDLLLLIYSN